MLFACFALPLHLQFRRAYGILPANKLTRIEEYTDSTAKRASICEAGICVVKDGKVVETRSWLVRPEANAYSYWNIQVHGIRPADTEDAPDFPEVWAEILQRLDDTPVLVAHNAAFDISCRSPPIQLLLQHA